jgi:hypothetical protein
MKKTNATYTYSLANGKMTIHSVVSDVKTVNTSTDAEIKHELTKRMKWVPADNFGHVVQQLKKGRVYLTRNGSEHRSDFLN